MTLIKNEKSWKEHLQQQQSRAPGANFTHFPAMPDEFPCLVSTKMFDAGCNVMRFYHDLGYADIVRDFIKAEK